MKYILLLSCFLWTTLLFAQDVPEKYQRAKISYEMFDNGLQQLEALGIPVDHGQHKKGHFIISEYAVSELETVRAAGFSVDVLIDDAKAYFLQQHRNPASFQNTSCAPNGDSYETPANFELGSMGGFFTYQEALAELDAMKAAYPNLITARAGIHTFLTEGEPDNSVSPSIGGNAIQWIKISDNPDQSNEGEPQILYSAIHHAREPMSLSQLIFYMWYLLENYDTDAEIKSIVDNTELYFVPVVNPDGYLYNEKTDPNGGGFWRKNRKNGHGVDNNRNYDYYIDGNPNTNTWGGQGTSGNTGSEVYRGTAPFSEVENQAMKWFVDNHDFVMAFNNHSFGNLLLYPYGYEDNVPTPEDALFEAVGNELVSRNGFANQISADLYPAAGTSDDFMYGTVGTHTKIYSYTPEIGPAFWPPTNDIIPIAKGMMYLNLTSTKMVNNYATVTSTGSLYIGDEGEQTAEYDIKRLGITGSGSFTVNLEPVSSNIVWRGGGDSYTAMDVLETQSGSINYVLAGGTTAGEDVVYDLVVNNGSFETKTRITKKFGVLNAAFEDPGNDVTTNFDNNGWGTTAATFVSPSSAITDSPGSDYSNNANETIALSNAIDLTDAFGATLNFYAKWEIETDWDYVQVEVSIDGGSNWEPQCGNFTNPGSSNNGQPTGEPLYDGLQEDWVLEEIDLSDYLGESILVRFQLVSDGAERRDGFYFDDLKVNIVEESILGVNEMAEAQFFVYPNPVDQTLSIETPLENYSIQVYSVQGQVLHSGENYSNKTELDFSKYASGIYLIRFVSQKTSKTVRVVKQ
ncbi:MAG: M14 family zinc carboxypeptidase [Marinirhabdus sp.]|nr:M14 family zinc carboxypeptidase [Marinirhabdus sp.]